MAALGAIVRAALIERQDFAAIAVAERKALPRQATLPKEEDVPPPEKDVVKRICWYFSEKTASSMDGGGGSTFNAMIQRMALYAKESKPCAECGGIQEVSEVIKDRSGQILYRKIHVQAVGGTGFIRDGRRFKEWEQLERLCLRETDRKAVAAWLLRNNEAIRRNPDGTNHPLGIGDHMCHPCGGTGWVSTWVHDHKLGEENWTVRETGIQFYKTIGGRDSDEDSDESMAQYAQVGRWRAAMREVDPISEAAFELYYSEDGGQNLSSLWPITPAGIGMLKHRPRGWSNNQFFSNLRMQQDRRREKAKRARDDAEERGTIARFVDRGGKKPVIPNMTKQFTKADRQAHTLRNRMCAPCARSGAPR